MSDVREITPEVDANAWLAGAQFIDAYRVEIGATNLDARQACVKMFLQDSYWANALVRLRNILVTPFGLKTSGEGSPAPGGLIGLFPVVSETPERLVAGFDDYHLDFRIVVDVDGHPGVRRVTLNTLVRTHNVLGRTYLALILPFHRLIARSKMRQIVSQAR
jgi:hypothetical protein